jgi:hypothetical protein
MYMLNMSSLLRFKLTYIIWLKIAMLVLAEFCKVNLDIV